MKCNLSHRKPTQAQIESQNQSVIRMNDRVFDYISRLLAISLRENAGFGAARFSRLSDNAYELGRDYIDRYSWSKDKRDEEYAVDSYYALRRDLRCYGWDPETELWSDEVFDHMASYKGLSRSKRDELAVLIAYAKGISFYVREMLCMSALELHDTNGFGAEVRLNRVFHPVRDRYLNLMRTYIAKDYASFKAELVAARDEFNALSVFGTETKI